MNKKSNKNNPKTQYRTLDEWRGVNMARKKEPLRKCVVSGEMKNKQDMIRIVRNREGEVFIDETGKLNGRGAYVSLDPELVIKAKEKDILSGVLKTKMTNEFYDELLERVKYQLARLEIMKQNE